MNQPQKNKVLVLIIAVLLIANIATLIVMTRQPKRDKGRKEAFSAYLKKDIGFSDEQLKAYDSLFDQHRKKLRADFGSMEEARKATFKKIAQDNFSDSVIEATAGTNKMFSEQIHVQMMHHIKDVRDLCTPAQREKFDTTFYKQLSRKNKNRK